MSRWEDSVTVWTYNEDPEWTRRNAGLTDMLLADLRDAGRARYLCERLLLLMPERTFELRDIQGQTVATFSIRPALKSSADECST